MVILLTEYFWTGDTCNLNLLETNLPTFSLAIEPCSLSLVQSISPSGTASIPLSHSTGAPSLLYESSLSFEIHIYPNYSIFLLSNHSKNTSQIHSHIFFFSCIRRVYGYSLLSYEDDYSFLGSRARLLSPTPSTSLASLLGISQLYYFRNSNLFIIFIVSFFERR